MLIVTRMPGEGLVIKTPFGEIRIRFLSRNRIGIEAPSVLPIVREELDSPP